MVRIALIFSLLSSFSGSLGLLASDCQTSEIKVARATTVTATVESSPNEVVETRTGFWIFNRGNATFFRDKDTTLISSTLVQDAGHLAILRRQIGEEAFKKLFEQNDPGAAIDLEFRRQLSENLGPKFVSEADLLRREVLAIPLTEPVPTRLIEQAHKMLWEANLSAPTFIEFIKRRHDAVSSKPIPSDAELRSLLLEFGYPESEWIGLMKQFHLEMSSPDPVALRLTGKWVKVEVVTGNVEARISGGKSAMDRESTLFLMAVEGYDKFHHNQLRLVLQFMFGSERVHYFIPAAKFKPHGEAGFFEASMQIAKDRTTGQLLIQGSGGQVPIENGDIQLLFYPRR